MLTQELVHEMFDYDAASGELRWKIRPRHHFPTERGWKIANRVFGGKVAGYANREGYRVVGIGGTQYKCHRVVWLYVHGVMPDEVDHENGAGAANGIGNLRAVDHPENMKNKRLYSSNKSGYPGVVWDKAKGLWVARIPINGKLKTLGRSKDKAKAIALKQKAERELGYHENHGRAV